MAYTNWGNGGTAGFYPLVEPAIRSAMSYFCKITKATSSGTVAMAIPAMTTGHGVDSPSLTGSCEIATISVCFSGSRRKTIGSRKSFQRAIREIAP